MEPTQQQQPTTNPNSPQAPNGQGKKFGIGIAVAAVVAILAVTVFAGKKSADQTTTATDPSNTSGQATTPATTPVPTTPSDSSGQATKTSTSEYKDGTYSATGSYVSPGGADQIGVSLTLKNDIVTDATVTPKPGDRESAHYQDIFAANYKQYVIGKDISTIKLSKVSGSSLTSGGFNAAVTQIEAQAKA